MIRGFEATGGTSDLAAAGPVVAARSARRRVAAFLRSRPALRVLLALPPALALAACANSARVAAPYGATPYGSPRVIAAPVDDIVPVAPNAPSTAVIAAPLPPTPGTVGAPDMPLPGADTVTPSSTDLSVAQDPAAALGQTPASGQQVASLPQTPAPAAAPPPTVAPTRTSVTGSWRASEAAGGSCRVVLSSSPSLDLYKASSSGCASQDLQSVNAWDLRGNEVYLYARGNVVARLRGGSGNFNGVLAKSGAPVSLNR